MVQQNGTVKITGTWFLVSMLQGGEERGPSVARVRDHVIRAVELWCGAEPRVRTGHVSVDIIDNVDTLNIVDNVGHLLPRLHHIHHHQHLLSGPDPGHKL